MTPRIARAFKKTDQGTSRADLEERVSMICFFRLLLLILLVVPLTFSIEGEISPQAFFQLLSERHFLTFLLAGFGVSLFFLLTWQRFSNIFLFFRLQLLADCLLCTYVVLVTGGTTSSFFFLFLGIIFLYGRLLGRQTAQFLGFALAALLLSLAALQYLQPLGYLQPSINIREALYYPSMQLISILLLGLLLRTGYASEHHLLQEVARKEQQLRRSEQLKSKVFDWMNSALLVVDPQGYISLINKTGMDMAGLKQNHQALGSHIGEFFPALAEAWKNWDQNEDLRKEAQEGDRVLGMTMAKLPEGMGTLILFRDITRLKILEDRVNQMEKMASLGELSAGLAHELKNPLAGIKTSLQLLQQSNLDEEQKEKLHNVVQKDIERMDQLVRDFLAFARPAEARPQEIDLGQSVQECLDTLIHFYKNVSFRMDSSLAGTFWSWDPEQLRQILLNLLLNAAQACSATSGAQVQVGLHHDDKGQHLFVRDNGPGLERDRVEELFDPFVTGKEGGSGLGLSIALRLANQNDSWIELSDSSQGGAEARLYRPRSRQLA